MSHEFQIELECRECGSNEIITTQQFNEHDAYYALDWTCESCQDEYVKENLL